MRWMVLGHLWPNGGFRVFKNLESEEVACREADKLAENDENCGYEFVVMQERKAIRVPRESRR